MFSYPLTFNASDEHVRHVKENSGFYLDIIDGPRKKHKPNPSEIEIFKQKMEDLEQANRVLKETNSVKLYNRKEADRTMGEIAFQLSEIQKQKIEQDKELIRMKEVMADSVKLEELLMKKSGTSVVYKGACDEKYVEIIMKEVASSLYIVDNSDGVQKMDVRLHRKDGAFTIGIECKDKDNVSKADLDKFKRDKVLNKFHRSVFISTSPIKRLVEGENQVLVKGDELYIVTKDPVFLGAVMKLYLSELENSDGSTPDCMVFDAIINAYETWQSSKKQLIKMDKAILTLMNLHPEFNEKCISKHLYLSIKSNMIKVNY